MAADGKNIDRKKLGSLVFADKAKRKQLESLTGYPIFCEIVS